jgi:hypothetical protein
MNPVALPARSAVWLPHSFGLALGVRAAKGGSCCRRSVGTAPLSGGADVHTDARGDACRDASADSDMLNNRAAEFPAAAAGDGPACAARRVADEAACDRGFWPPLPRASGLPAGADGDGGPWALGPRGASPTPR